MTLTGLGGIGKTRLAVAAAEEAFRRRSRTATNFVALADVNAPESLPEVVLEAVSVRPALTETLTP